MLRPLQNIFDARDHPQLQVGLSAPDDAAVWHLDDEKALVVTIDFFTPVVDEAYDYGAIAAANSLSDLYAMGATPFLALNVAAMPVDLPMEIVTEIMRGGAEKVKEAGAVIAGGHTIQDDEPKYGLVAIGICSHDHLMIKDQVQVGDVLILTKPLGMGVTTTALKRSVASQGDVDQAVTWMAKLNGAAARLAFEFEVKAATDITGFGFLGHSIEMAEASSLAFRFHIPSIPFLSGARRYAETGNFPGGSYDNKSYFKDRVSFDTSIDDSNQMLLFDAQTSGGLLLALSADELGAFLLRAEEEKVDAWAVGIAETGQGIEVLDTPISIDPPVDRNRGDLWFTNQR